MATHGWNMPGCPNTQTGDWTPDWYEWDRFGRPALFRCMHDGNWAHMLVADVNESDPDANHVHLKFHGGSSWRDVVLASVKIDGVRVINRGDLLKKINALIGTSFTVRDLQG